MARTAPAPNIPPIPGMCPSIAVLAGGGDGGGDSGDSAGDGNGDDNAGANQGGEDASGDSRGAPDYEKYPECGYASHPVDVVTGRAFTHPITDLELPGPLPLVFQRMFSSKMAGRDAGLGFGWGHTFGWEIEVGRRRITVWNEQGIAVDFPMIATGDQVIGPWGWVLRRETWGFAVDADDGVWRLFSAVEKDGRRVRLTAVEDRNRNRISLAYEAGCLVEIVDSAGRTLRVVPTREGRIGALRMLNATSQGQWLALATYTYDEHGNLAAATDADGYSARYEYDDDHRLTSDTDRAGLCFHFVYDIEGRCAESWGDYPGKRDPSLTEGLPKYLYDGITRAKGVHHCKFDYGAGGYTEVVDSREVRRFFGNRHGLLDKSVIGGAAMTCRYDGNGHILSRTDEVGATTSFERDARGRLLRETDPLGRSTSYVLDALGLPTEIVDGAGGVSSFVRDRFGNLQTSVDPAGGVTAYVHDARGLVTEITSPTGARTRVEYDTAGNAVAITQPNGGVYRFTYDVFGRRTSQTDPTGVVTYLFYSQRGDLIGVRNGAGGATRYDYDGEGHLTGVTDPEGRRIDLAWGGYHKLVARRNADGAVELRYNYEGELVLVRNAKGELHRMGYDPSGQLIEEQTFDGRHLRYRYDAAGRLIRYSQGERLRTNFVYNVAGELVERASGDDVETFEYDGRGDLVRAVGSAAEIILERDVAGRVVAEVQSIGDEAHTVRRTLDAGGAWIERTTTLGHSEQVERDAMGGRARTVFGHGYALTHERDLLGRELAVALPHGGRIETRYNAIGRVDRRTVTSQVGPRQAAPGEPAWLGVRRDGVTVDKTYGYDLSSELLQVNEPQRGARSYRYDPVGQLVEALPERGRREVFGYDADGNVFESGEGAKPRAYGPGDRLLQRGDVTYVWDVDGRLVEKRERERVWRYAWKPGGLLESVERPDGTLVEFAYDPLARRVQKRVSVRGNGSARSEVERTRFVWDEHEIVHEIKQRALAGGDPIIEERTYCFEDADAFVPFAHRESRPGAEPAWYHYVNDPSGAPEELVDAAGQVVASLDVSAFARAPAAGTQVGTPIRFQGQYADSETGLYYNRFRYYDPEVGRYLSPDPLGLKAGINAFVYGRNPLHWVDPLGLATNTPNTGVIYLRTDKKTGKQYVGKAKSKEAYERRKAAHNRKAKKGCAGHPGYDFQELETGVGTPADLAQREEDWIRVGGGPGGHGQGGPLENKIHGQSSTNYGGSIPFP